MTLEILSKIERIGGQILLEGERLKVRIPESYPEANVLVEEVRAHKPEIIAMLRPSRPATCAASCYEVEPGRWIHHPWDGCRTLPRSQPKPVARVEAACWHCHGLKECRCIVCWDALRDSAGECVACHGAGVTLAWLQ